MLTKSFSYQKHGNGFSQQVHLDKDLRDKTRQLDKQIELWP